MEKIKLGILGLGNQGTTYAKKLVEGECPDVELVAIADSNPDRIAWGKENLKKEITYFASFEEMADSGLINGCLVVVPHYDHVKFAKACIDRGIHVLVDKPAGVFTKEVRELNAYADAHPEVVFGMMFNQRTNPVYCKARELVNSGKYGQLRRSIWVITNWYRSQFYYDSGAWRATWSGEGGGVLMNQCPHQLDLWQWICGMPKSVHSHMLFGKWHDIEVEDDVTTYVQYENGASGVFITTTGDGKGTNCLEIQMDGAKIVCYDKKLELYEFDVHEPEFSKTCTTPFGAPKTTLTEFEFEDKGPQHMGVLAAWAGAILRGEPMIAPGQEGINGLTLSNAMHLSAWTNQTVQLPLDEDLFYEELMKRVATSKRKENVKSVVVDTSNTFGGA